MVSSTGGSCGCGCVSYYNISIVDNQSGEEVVTFDSDETNLCYKDVVHRVMNWVNKKPAVDYITENMSDIRAELAKGGGEKTNTFLEMVGKSNSRTNLIRLRRMSTFSDNDKDFIESIFDFYRLN